MAPWSAATAAAGRPRRSSAPPCRHRRPLANPLRRTRRSIASSTPLRDVFDKLTIDPPAYLPVVYPTQNGKADGARQAGSSRRGRAARHRRPLAPPLRRPPGVHARLRGGVARSRCRSAPTRCACSVRPGHASATCPGPDRRVEGGQRDVRRLAGTTRAASVTEPDPTATRGKVHPPHGEGSAGAAEVPPHPRRPPRCRGGRPSGPPPSMTCAHALEPLVGDGTSGLLSARLRASTPTRTTGAPASGNDRRRCPTTPWCCTAAATPTAAESARTRRMPRDVAGWIGAPLSPRRRAAPPGRRGVRRAGHRGRGHRCRRRARCRQPRSEDGARREGRLRLGDLVEVLEDGARRHPLPPAARVPPRLREPGRAPTPARQRATPRLARCPS